MRRLILMSILVIVSCLSFVTSSNAAIPHVMNYQGKAMDRNTSAPLNGNYNLTFRIYNTPTGGAAKWAETQTNIAITNGVFQVLLGSATPLNLAFDEDYWISLEINTDTEMSPRTRLASVPYAYKADKANSLDASYAVPVLDSVISRGFELVYDSPATVKVNAGTLAHGQTRVNKVENKILTLNNLDDWYDGSIHSYVNKAGWCYVGVDNAGNIRLLGANPPNKADTAGNTAGTLLYSYLGSTYYRVIGAVHISTGNAIDLKWFQTGNYVALDIPVSLTTSLSTGAWSSALSCAAGMPAISMMGEFAIYIAGAATGAGEGVGIRPNGSTYDTIIRHAIGCGAVGTSTFGQYVERCMTDASQQIQYYTYSGGTTLVEIAIKGYYLNIR